MTELKMANLGKMLKAYKDMTEPELQRLGYMTLRALADAEPRCWVSYTDLASAVSARIGREVSVEEQIVIMPLLLHAKLVRRQVSGLDVFWRIRPNGRAEVNEPADALAWFADLILARLGV